MANRTHEQNAMRIMNSAPERARVELHQATALCALVYAVLDLAQAVRELK